MPPNITYTLILESLRLLTYTVENSVDKADVNQRLDANGLEISHVGKGLLVPVINQLTGINVALNDQYTKVDEVFHNMKLLAIQKEGKGGIRRYDGPLMGLHQDPTS
ncbi:unnamed protein product [Umbelopsis sp. WA50703]